MHVAYDLKQAPPGAPTAITIGVFDGVHLGHQRLIQAAVRSAHARGWSAVVVTFFPHPAVVLGRAQPYYITSNAEKLGLFERLGVDTAVVVEFSLELSRMPAEAFVDLLCGNLRMAELWMGYDFVFGYQRQGNAEYLRREGEKRGFAVQAISTPVLLDGAAVSSSRIRAALRAGDLQQVHACLGRPLRVSGVVIGSSRCATSHAMAGVELALWRDQALPPDGTYKCYVEAGAPAQPGLVHLGTRLMAGQAERTCDVFWPTQVSLASDQTVHVDLTERAPASTCPANWDEFVGCLPARLPWTAFGVTRT